MVNPLMLYNKIISMPPDVAEEVNDFVDFVLQKKQRYGNEDQNVRMENTNNNFEKLPEIGFGCMKGMFKMAPDFDEPSENFKEYM